MQDQYSTEASPPCSPGAFPNSPSPSAGTGTRQHSPSPVQSHRARSPTPACSVSASTTPVSSTPPSTPGSTRQFLIAPMSMRRARSQEDRFMISTISAVSKSGSASNLLARHERSSLERRRNRSCDALVESGIKNTVETVPDGSATVKSSSGQSKSRLKSLAKLLPHLKKTDRQSSVRSMQEGAYVIHGTSLPTSFYSVFLVAIFMPYIRAYTTHKNWPRKVRNFFKTWLCTPEMTFECLPRLLIKLAHLYLSFTYTGPQTYMAGRGWEHWSN